MKWVSITGFALAAFAFVADFANGVMCTRIAWLIIGPVELLYLPGFVLMLVGTVAAAVRYVRSKRMHQQAVGSDGGWLIATAALFGLLYFTNIDSRLSGLALRARMREQTLVDFAAKYRARGEVGVKDHPVLGWNSELQPQISATAKYVEVSWGSTLLRSWGFRIDDSPDRPMPQFQPISDAAAMSATARITVFIGVF